MIRMFIIVEIIYSILFLVGLGLYWYNPNIFETNQVVQEQTK